METATGQHAKLIDGAIAQVGGLPATGYRLVDDCACPVSNFHCLTAEELATACDADGNPTPWYPVVHDPPAYDDATERLSAPSYEIRDGDVLATYTVEAKPEEAP